ncbi:Carotenoid cleavage dioxygenase 7, chloroplastic [Sarracenia purpurea var. burkii]
MEAKSCEVIPPPLPSASLVSTPPPNKVSLPAKLTRAISITAPVDLVSTRRDVDDSAAAFWDYQFLFVSQRSESAEPLALRVVDGAIPPDIPSGTYYLTAPGLFSDDHGSTVHHLDGHGYLRAFAIDGVKGEVKFMARCEEGDRDENNVAFCGEEDDCFACGNAVIRTRFRRTRWIPLENSEWLAVASCRCGRAEKWRLVSGMWRQQC